MPDRVEIRALRAAEAILRSDSLTVDLSDAEAAALLEWGLARAEACARTTAKLADAPAKAKIDQSILTIRKSVCRINSLLADRGDLNEEQIGKRLEALLLIAADLPLPQNRRRQKGNSKKAVDQIPRLVKQAAQLSDARLLARVLALADAAAAERQAR